MNTFYLGTSQKLIKYIIILILIIDSYYYSQFKNQELYKID